MSLKSNVYIEIRRKVSIKIFYNSVKRAERELAKAPGRPTETDTRETVSVESDLLPKVGRTRPNTRRW